MAQARLEGKKVAVLATDGFEQVELEKPVAALRAAGAQVEVIAPKDGEIQGFNHHDKGDKVRVDRALASASPRDYDAIVLPGGVLNPDALRLEDEAIAFIRAFAEAVQGRRMTSWPSLEADLRNAGADWVDEEVVVDKGLVTSRNPDDLPAFCAKMIEEIAEGRHDRG